MEEEEFNSQVEGGDHHQHKGVKNESMIEDAYGESHPKGSEVHIDIHAGAAEGTPRGSGGLQEPDSDSKTRKARNPF